MAKNQEKLKFLIWLLFIKKKMGKNILKMA